MKLDVLFLVIISVRLEFTWAQVEMEQQQREKFERCIETLHQPTECCLTTICWKYNYFITTNKKNHTNYDKEMEKYKTLCSENVVYLFKEHLSGNCNDTNSQMNENSEKGDKFSIYATTSTLKSVPSNFQLEDDKKIRFGNISETTTLSTLSSSSTAVVGLQFLDIPKGDEMRIYDLSIDKEVYLLFGTFSNLMAYLLPSQFPTELLNDFHHLSIHILLFQIFKHEILLLVWLLVFAILSICLPIAVLLHLFCTNKENSINSQNKCSKRRIGFLLHTLLVPFVCAILLIIVGNEQISRSIENAPFTANLIQDDINTFLRNTHMQITFVTTSTTDIAIESVRKDLQDIQTLLGNPYKSVLAMETGIDVALDALNELKMNTAQVTNLLADLLDECYIAQRTTISLQQQLTDIARQLSIARQQCSLTDRSLCYTLQYSGYDVIYTTENFTNDAKIKQFHQIGLEKRFNTSIENAHRAFMEIPHRVSMELSTSIADIKALLSRKRSQVYQSTHELDILTRSLSEDVSKSAQIVSSYIAKLLDFDIWRWMTVLSIASILTLIWALLLCGTPCGCRFTSHTKPFLHIAIGLSTVICLVVWMLGTIAILLAGPTHSLICQPLYDLLRNTNISLKPNTTLQFHQVLKNCENNQPAYNTFHLYNYLNIDTVTNYKTWQDFHQELNNLTFFNELEILSPALQVHLQILSTLTTINFTNHHEQLSGPLTRRDLVSFADQLSSVARQLNDAASARRIDNVAFYVRQTVNGEWRIYNDIRKRIIYKITLLQVLLKPLQKSTNHTLNHLKSVQFFIDTKGWTITDKVRNAFISRIENTLQHLYDNVKNKVSQEIGKCHPLWEICHSIRSYICKLIVDPLNGIAFCCFFLIFLFIIITPIVFKLLNYHHENLFTAFSHRRTRDSRIIDDEGTWATPTSTPPDPTSSLSPLRPYSVSSQIPSPRIAQIPSLPPKSSKLSSIAARLTSTRFGQMSSVSRARSPKRYRNESLRLIEPICWQTGSTTPKSWL